MIDPNKALILLAELRATEQRQLYHLADAYLLSQDASVPNVKMLERARGIARERGIPWREGFSIFRSPALHTLTHPLPTIAYLN
jgi:hypothetical protein